MMRRILDVDACAVSSGADGSVGFDDPACPWLVRVWTHTQAGRTRLARLEITARNPVEVGIGSAAALCRLPVGQLLQVAARQAHPDEVYWRMLAKPKAPGQRSWGPEHWAAVLAVAGWARETDRPGGAVRAVADLWNVSAIPTADRWLAHARAQLPAGGSG